MPITHGVQLTAVVADDHALMREGLAQLLERGGRFTVVGLAADGAEAVALALRERPAVVLMDIAMPGCDGIEATGRLLAAWPDARVLAVTTFAGLEAVVPMLRAGAAGYVLKDATPDELTQAALAVVEGRTTLSPTVVDALVERVRTQEPRRDPGLEPEARRVRDELGSDGMDLLDQLARGRGNARIATALHVSEATVKARLTRLMATMRVTSRAQAIVRGCELGLVRARLED